MPEPETEQSETEDTLSQFAQKWARAGAVFSKNLYGDLSFLPIGLERHVELHRTGRSGPAGPCDACATGVDSGATGKAGVIAFTCGITGSVPGAGA
ncbi:hypothetical protein M0D69_01315 [Caballeronia sp. SEWSISQ10-4 2]|uniref:hypothetical protein n=1 Tax=Caballeronia sp. SEWSISQ10-4 2 TaxID=2937438 RepID=UPI002651B334|nr:hypothetical protein [Caballeronia sp. SEWSISQ10-4 2]MDN7176681.1 hypothetical protein [Caballeronia sp. SEWSISQ10-4 2]